MAPNGEQGFVAPGTSIPQNMWRFPEAKEENAAPDLGLQPQDAGPEPSGYGPMTGGLSQAASMRAGPYSFSTGAAAQQRPQGDAGEPGPPGAPGMLDSMGLPSSYQDSSQGGEQGVVPEGTEPLPVGPVATTPSDVQAAGLQVLGNLQQTLEQAQAQAGLLGYGNAATAAQFSSGAGLAPSGSAQDGLVAAGQQLGDPAGGAAAPGVMDYTALAKYYAAAASVPQLAAAGQPMDAYQQAALAQYNLYAAAYAAHAQAAAAGGTGLGPGLGSGLGASSSEGPSNAWITNRLIDREKARLDRNFEEADRIRSELRQRGIEVDDRLRTWSSRDGRRGHRPNHNDIPEPEPE
mmetsp:Transcript_45848/g.130910  ORF Transcript_45848/g.130910 Transcript_45848/m.130910 type:complete len:348 (-) Transcript_45848:86-1129(-)